jgi:tRNA (guanine37-N1)-methyltransferase
MAMKISIVTLFPEMIESASSFGVCGRAVRRGLVDLTTVDPRDFADDPHRTVDDRPYGGGPGMVLKVEPLGTAIRSARASLPSGSPVIFLTPQGRRFDQELARELADLPGMILVAGRYEGFDERLIASEADDEISLGDFVMSGGEIAAIAIADAVIRLQPNVLGDEASAREDSFTDDLLDFPQFTRPESVDGMDIPPVLKEGNHEEIRRWRLKQSLGRTYLRRPELFRNRELTQEELRLLQEFLTENELDLDEGGPVRH